MAKKYVKVKIFHRPCPTCNGTGWLDIDTYAHILKTWMEYYSIREERLMLYYMEKLICFYQLFDKEK